MFDSHVHLYADEDAILARARASGVTGFMTAGVDPLGWQQQQNISARHPDVAYALGLHPQVAAEWTDAQCDDALAQLGTPRVIGEIGLDRAGNLERQERVFRAQLAVARACNAPVILHILKRQQEALRILKADGLPKAGGVVHSYSGSADMPYLQLGLHIALCGTVTFANATKLLEVARHCPLDRLLVETDSPDQTPQPHRPGKNEPAFLRAIVQRIADVRGVGFDEVAQATAKNARRLFRLDAPEAKR